MGYLYRYLRWWWPGRSQLSLLLGLSLLRLPLLKLVLNLHRPLLNHGRRHLIFLEHLRRAPHRALGTRLFLGAPSPIIIIIIKARRRVPVVDPIRSNLWRHLLSFAVVDGRWLSLSLGSWILEALPAQDGDLLYLAGFAHAKGVRLVGKL